MQGSSHLLSARDVASLLDRVRTRRPRVHCITNFVAQNFTANMLLALGAVPAMTVARAEIADFVDRADALLVNLGTLDEERRAGAGLAIEVIAGRGRPWALDPVFVDASPLRLEFARRLLAGRPSLVRANASELAVLAEDGAGALADATGGVVALTGRLDRVTDGVRSLEIANGDPLMERVTAVGCAGTAVMCAFLAVAEDPFAAAAAGLAVMGIAGEIAAERSAGPGSFAVALIDAVYALDGADIEKRIKIR
ncbi:MAG TPA: hydroxyethylthiazole kinase [Kaistiaceae bacterium]|nr:hydroxyethylthiazole kinase [Kaistiaceae bacterium]